MRETGLAWLEGMGVGGGDVPLCFLFVLLAAAGAGRTAAFLLELLEAGAAEFFEVGVGHFGGGLRCGYGVEVWIFAFWFYEWGIGRGADGNLWC